MFAKRVEVEGAAIEQEQKQFAKALFHCEEDAKQAIEACMKALAPTFHTLKAEVVQVEQPKKRRGRPKKEAVLEMETHYVVQLHYGVNEQVVAQEKRRASRFVLATTLPVAWQDRTMDGPELLAMYKGQIHVEMNFAFLKDPFYTDEMYLKSLNVSWC